MSPLQRGATAPDFTLKDQYNQDVRLADFRGRKAVLLVFYPLAFSGTCEGELTEVKSHLPDYQNETVQVLTVSVDSTWAHRIWADREQFEFPLLADFWPHGAVAQLYGVFNDVAGFANRGTFLVDKDGIVRFAEMNAPGEGRDANDWRAAIKSL